jgi:hypothetical protein
MSKPAKVIKSFERRGEEGYSQTEALMAALELVSINAELLKALEALYEHCAMVHKHWGEGSNQRQADEAIKAGRAAIAKAKGE